MSLAIGLDVGGTTLRAALVDEAGVVIEHAKRPLQGRSPQAVIDQLAGLVDSLGQSTPALPLGMGFAGLLWVKKGVVAVAPAYGWADVPMGEMLAERFGRPVRLVNDLDAICIGETVCGAGHRSRDVICVFVGTGVGMGAVCQGQLLEGADGLATELGHIKVASPLTGRRCGCGEHGCLEAYTSGSHLPQLLVAKGAEGFSSPLLTSVGGDLSKINALTIEAAAVAGDAAARALWSDVAERLGLAIANCVTVLNPQVLVLGGGVLLLAPSLRSAVVQHLRQAVARSHLKNLEICDARLGDDAGLVGAGLLAHESLGRPLQLCC
jgi:glucokinase